MHCPPGIGKRAIGVIAVTAGALLLVLSSGDAHDWRSRSRLAPQHTGLDERSQGGSSDRGHCTGATARRVAALEYPQHRGRSACDGGEQQRARERGRARDSSPGRQRDRRRGRHGIRTGGDVPGGWKSRWRRLHAHPSQRRSFLRARLPGGRAARLHPRHVPGCERARHGEEPDRLSRVGCAGVGGGAHDGPRALRVNATREGDGARNSPGGQRIHRRQHVRGVDPGQRGSHWQVRGRRGVSAQWPAARHSDRCSGSPHSRTRFAPLRATARRRFTPDRLRTGSPRR